MNVFRDLLPEMKGQRYRAGVEQMLGALSQRSQKPSSSRTCSSTGRSVYLREWRTGKRPGAVDLVGRREEVASHSRDLLRSEPFQYQRARRRIDEAGQLGHDPDFGRI